MEYQNKTITLKDGRTALLRAVCKEDAIPMIAYMKACYEQTPYLMRYPDEFAVTAEQEATYLERQLVSPDVLMLVCEVEGKLAGNCQLDLNRWRKTRHRGQVAIALLKDYWGLGIGTAMFEEMIEGIKLETVKFLFHVRVERPVEREKVAEETSASHGEDDKSLKKEPVRNDHKFGRNDLCPCGSGKKYKNCCGREA